VATPLHQAAFGHYPGQHSGAREPSLPLTPLDSGRRGAGYSPRSVNANWGALAPRRLVGRYAPSELAARSPVGSCRARERLIPDELGMLENVALASWWHPCDRVRISLPDVSAAVANTGERRAVS